MKKNRRIVATAVLSLLCFTATAQLATNTSQYKTAIGLRGGGTSGITIKHFVSSQAALDGIVSLWGNGIGLTLLYERHQTAFNVDGLQWYYGAGGHVALNFDRNYRYKNDNFFYHNREGNIGVGVDGIVGIEYKINPLPIAISLDFKPFLELNSNGSVFIAADSGLGIKLTF